MSPCAFEHGRRAVGKFHHHMWFTGGFRCARWIDRQRRDAKETGRRWRTGSGVVPDIGDRMIKSSLLQRDQFLLRIRLPLRRAEGSGEEMIFAQQLLVIK